MSEATVVETVVRRNVDVLIICSHEPELDPRIGWIASHTPPGIAPIVIGTHDNRRPRPARVELPKGGELQRVDGLSLLQSTISLLKWFFEHAPLRLQLPAAVVLLLLGPPALLIFELVALFYGAARVASTGEWAALGQHSFVMAALRTAGRRFFTFGPRGSDSATERAPQPAATMAGAPTPDRFRAFGAAGIHLIRTTATLVQACRMRNDIRLVHANDLDTLGAAVLLKWERGCRVIYDAHEYWPYVDVDASRFEQRVWAWLEHSLVRHVDAAFAVSAPLTEALTRDTGLAFAELPNAEPARVPRHIRPASEASPLRFVFLGSFHPDRGLDELIEAWSRLDGTGPRLHLRGPASSDKHRLQKLAIRLGVFGRTVHFEDPVLETELVACAAEYDVGVIPYKSVNLGYRYCCPNKLSQYMQAGVAILTNNLTYVRELVERFGCGTHYDSNFPDTLIDAVRTLDADRRRLQEMKRRAVDAAQSEFNWQRQSTPLYDAYQRLA